MSAVVFYYRRSEFTADGQFTIRSVFATGESLGKEVQLFYLQVELFCLQFWLFAYSFSYFAYSGKVRLVRALRDCKQRSLLHPIVQGAAKRRSAKGVRSLFLVFRSLSVTFWSLSSDASVTFFPSLFCQP